MPRMGDVVFWTFGSRIYTGSHVAIVWGGVQGDTIDVLTQNPTPAVHQTLPLMKGSQLLGYLHPTALPEPPESGDNPTGGNNPGVNVDGDVSAWIQLQGDNLIYHNGSGTTSSQTVFIGRVLRRGCIVVVRVSRTPTMVRARQAWVMGKAHMRFMSSAPWNRHCVGMLWNPIIRVLVSRNGRSVGVCKC